MFICELNDDDVGGLTAQTLDFHRSLFINDAKIAGKVDVNRLQQKQWEDGSRWGDTWLFNEKTVDQWKYWEQMSHTFILCICSFGNFLRKELRQLPET